MRARCLRRITLRRLKQRISELLSVITGWELERFDRKSFAIIDRNKRANAWFSHRSQLRALIEGFGVDLVIDVGANQGQFAKALRSYYAGEILSFEPVSSAFEVLAKAASGDPGWRVYKFALGSREAVEAINVSDRTVFSSLLVANEYCARRFGDESSVSRQEAVTVRRLDTVLADVVSNAETRRIFLKMDTQGYDMEVFKGLGRYVESVVAMQSELSLISIYKGMPHWTESVAIYEKSGFGVVGMFPVNRDSLKVIEYDCLLARG